MTSIERTAYPQFRRLTSARVLHVFFTPTAEEIGWAQERTAGQESLFALVLALKCFQKMARFCPLEEIPEAVTGHVRRWPGGRNRTIRPGAGSRATDELRSPVTSWPGFCMPGLAWLRAGARRLTIRARAGKDADRIWSQANRSSIGPRHAEGRPPGAAVTTPEHPLVRASRRRLPTKCAGRTESQQPWPP